MNNRNPWAKFSRWHFICVPYSVSLEGKKCLTLPFPSTEWCISVGRMQETEKTAAFPTSVGHICEEK